MSESHKKLPKFFWIQLALAATIGIIYLITPSEHGGEQNTETDNKAETIAKNLALVGSVSTKEAQTTGSAKARSGEEVYKASCQACHSTGIANAPKPDDKAAWEPRVATGLDTLIKTAINGKGAMPARGGNPAITDEEIKAVIIYMTSKAGFDLSSAEKPKATTVTTQKTKRPIIMPTAITKTIEKDPEAS
jgi:cytochrome c5